MRIKLLDQLFDDVFHSPPIKPKKVKKTEFQVYNKDQYLNYPVYSGFDREEAEGIASRVDGYIEEVEFYF